MNREETKKCIEVMQHYVDGGEVEITTDHSIICPSPSDLVWDWSGNSDKYRIVPKTKKVKLLAYLGPQALVLVPPGGYAMGGWKRVPSEDKEIEVAE